MEQELTPYGKNLKKRLLAIGKDEQWLVETLQSEGNSTTLEILHGIMIGEYRSEPKKALIGRVLHTEEQRQKLKRIVGIKE